MKLQGFIYKIIAGDYFVYANGKTYICKARGLFRNNDIKPLCGDYVEIDFENETDYSIISKILPRKNKLIRPPVANIDLALIIMSTIKPSFDSYLVDKIIVQCELYSIEPILCVSKCEYLTPQLKSLIDNYQLAGYKTICFSAHNNINIDEILNIIKDKKVVLCGQSAVGKSSLINTITKEETKSIGSFSEKLGRGRHETREVEFLNIHGGFIADSPGFSKLELNIDAQTLSRIFKDFDKYTPECKYNTCLHHNEPHCKIKEAVKNKLIDERRYNNYLHLLNEIKEGKQTWRKK